MSPKSLKWITQDNCVDKEIDESDLSKLWEVIEKDYSKAVYYCSEFINKYVPESGLLSLKQQEINNLRKNNFNLKNFLNYVLTDPSETRASDFIYRGLTYNDTNFPLKEKVN